MYLVNMSSITTSVFISSFVIILIGLHIDHCQPYNNRYLDLSNHTTIRPFFNRRREGRFGVSRLNHLLQNSKHCFYYFIYSFVEQEVLQDLEEVHDLVGDVHRGTPLDRGKYKIGANKTTVTL